MVRLRRGGKGRYGWYQRKEEHGRTAFVLLDQSLNSHRRNCLNDDAARTVCSLFRLTPRRVPLVDHPSAAIRLQNRRIPAYASLPWWQRLTDYLEPLRLSVFAVHL